MLNRVLTFAGKARHRGFSYVGAVFAYYFHAVCYRLTAFSRRLGRSAATSSEAPRPEFHFAPEDVPGIVARVSASAKLATILEARQYLEGKFSFRGLPEVHFPEAVDWNFAPEENRSWSWDLNRHRFFLTLGTAYHYTQDAAYLEKLTALWQDWMQRNPAGKGRNWRSPFEVAARLRNWIWAYFLLAASPEARPEFLQRAWNGISQHAAFLADHLEYHWPNNHLLLEVLSLCEFAVVFQGSGGERYLPLASRVLAEQVESQILTDGVHGELGPMYHEIVASELHAFVQLCHKLRYRLPSAMEDRIRAMRRFSVALRRGDGSFPLLGDSSSLDTCLRFDMACPASSDLAYWLQPDAHFAEAASTPAPLGVALFPEAGYGVLRSAAMDTHLTFDFGPFSRCAAANHAHADALSFELQAAGRPWIVDSGFFHPWKETADWSRYFRSTAAHNTLLIDGKEQSELSELWDVGRQAQTHLAEYHSNSEEVAVCGQVAPYWFGGKVVHRREVVLSRAGEITIRDRVLRNPARGLRSPASDSSGAKYRLQWFFHFAPDLHLEFSGADGVLARGDGGTLLCTVRTTGRAPELRLVRGQEVPRQGWVAQSSARVAPAWVLVVETETTLPCEVMFHCLITPAVAGTGLVNDSYRSAA